MKISVVIPAYNEETNIRLGALDQVARYLSVQPYTWEVILVDDGSTDATPGLLDHFVKGNDRFSVYHNPHQGKASSVITGILKGEGSIIVFSDLDQATPIYELARLLPWFGKDFDIVIGSRSSKREGAPLFRIIMARGFMLLRTVILGLNGISDTQCGFKGFKRDVAKQIFRKLALYKEQSRVSGTSVTAGFDIELLYLGKKMGFRIKEVPVEWHYVETRRVNPLRDSWFGLLDLLRIRMSELRGQYRS